ncbi:MAG: divalent-cation tolerance protein CutA [Bacteroidia bacterium]|nr:divalent-cation tolerance protein CutA [Bacteroidia bacterium]MDW8159652.1 divalent-cation tolerance protein CutA [Bacteroidia bacterium]
MNIEYIIVYIPCPTKENAEKIGYELVAQKLAACINIVSEIQSSYWWENKVQQDKEALLLVKSKLALFSSLEQKVKELHPYKVPCIIALPIIQGNQSYLEWMDNCLNA